MRGAASLAAAAARWPVRVRGTSQGRQVAGAAERRRSGRCGGCGAEVRGPRVEEVSRAASRCHDGAAPVGAGCSPAPAPPPGGVCLPLPSLLRRGRRHCPSPPQPGRPFPPPNTHPPARPPSWRRARPPAAPVTEARAPATPFSFLCLCPRDRLLGSTDHSAAARPLPSATPEAGRAFSRRAISVPPRLPPPAFLRGVLTPPPPRAQPPGPPVPGWVPGPRPTPLGLPILQPARSLEPYPAALLGCSAGAASPRVAAAGLRLHRVAQAALLRAEGPQELPRAPSARLAELLAPRRRPGGRGDARSPPPPGPAAPLT